MSSIAQPTRFLAELQFHRILKAKSQIEPHIRPKCSQSIGVGWLYWHVRHVRSLYAITVQLVIGRDRSFRQIRKLQCGLCATHSLPERRV